MVLLVLLVPGWSYERALTSPGSAGWEDRSVGWFADHGGQRIVRRVEQWYYTHNAPSTLPDAPPDTPSPTLPAPVAATLSVLGPAGPPPSAPAPVVTHFPVPMPGEGHWAATGRSVGGRSTVLATAFRPDPVHPGVVVGAAWMDTSLVKPVLVPGVKDFGSGWAWGGAIPMSARPTLVAAFNSGFRPVDTKGGLYSEGRMARSLVDGQASLVIATDGTATVGMWGRDATMSPDVASVRQNLELIVDGGVAAPGLAANADGSWGTRRQQYQYTWRSGLGVTADGALVYVAGADLTLTALAAALVDVGAVRAMQLDIHDNKDTFNIYDPAPGSADGVTAYKLLDDMQRPATRYLNPDQRDFVAITLR